MLRLIEGGKSNDVDVVHGADLIEISKPASRLQIDGGYDLDA